MDLRDQLQLSLGSGYTLERELGGGGMSQVFVAEEISLGRKIVVKVLPGDACSGVSVERFRREIQVAARLQHPHIVPLLSAGEADGIPFYTMPFVQGESLRARLVRGGELSVNEALHILHDVAAALAYAHAEGVVHRDIKPENVIVSGRVAVVTDFGVAKAMDAASSQPNARTGLTSFGVALGTPAYMSPEQASADPQVDHRADIYSFGCLAYELLCGASPFAGRAPQQMLAAHVTETPEPLLKRRPATPPSLATLVMRCLEKHAGDRPQSADDLLVALDAIATPSGGTSPTGARLRAVTGSRRHWLAAGVGAVVVAVVAWVLLRDDAAPVFAVGSTHGIALTPAMELSPALSRDGRFVAYVAQTSENTNDRVLVIPVGAQAAATTRHGRIFVRQVDGGRPIALSPELPGNHDHPAWSPDGTRIAFVTDDGVYVVAAFGGTARRLIECVGSCVTPAWSPDGASIAYADVSGVWVRSFDGGGAPRLVARGLVHSPAFSPDGTRLAYVSGNKPVIGNTSTTAIWIVPLAAGAEPVRVSDEVHVNASPQWTPDGDALLYLSSRGGGNLDVFQQSLAGDGTASGEPARLTTGLSALAFSLSADGSRAAYDVVRVQSNIWSATVDGARRGSPVTFASARQITRDNQVIEGIALSADGNWLAYDSNRRGNFDIYKVPAGGGEPVQLTDDPANDFVPGWSPDGREIVFHTTRGGNRDVYVIGADGGAEQVVVATPAEELQGRWSPDGRRIAYTLQDTLVRHGVADRDGEAWRASGPFRLTPRPTVGSGLFSRNLPQVNWSPDGRLLTRIVGGDVVVFAPDGTDTRIVARLGALGYQPLVSLWATHPDTLYVHALNRRGASVFLALPMSGGAPRELLIGDNDESAYRGEFATDGRRFFFVLPKVEADVSVMELRRP